MAAWRAILNTAQFLTHRLQTRHYHVIRYHGNRHLWRNLPVAIVSPSPWQPRVAMVTPKRYAGHSKWQNIRHIKGAKDAIKARNSSEAVREINRAIKEGNGCDPKFNFHLARAIERAEKKDVPKTVIQNAIKRVKDGKPSTTHYYEIRGPGNCALIVEAYTDSVIKTKNDLQSLMKKVGGRVEANQALAYVFDKKGMIYIAGEGMTYDQAEELAIEAGAEDLEETEGDDGPEYRLICAPDEVFMVKQMLEVKNIPINKHDTEFIPLQMKAISEEAQNQVRKLFDKFDYIDEIVRVFDNIEVTESSEV